MYWSNRELQKNDISKDNFSVGTEGNRLTLSEPC